MTTLRKTNTPRCLLAFTLLALCFTQTTPAQQPPQNIDDPTPQQILQKAFDRERAMGNVRGVSRFVDLHPDDRVWHTSRGDHFEFLYHVNNDFDITGFRVAYSLRWSDDENYPIVVTVWDGTTHVKFLPGSNKLMKFSNRTMGHPEWEMYEDATSYLKSPWPLIWPMRYWLSDLEEQGLDDARLRVESREGEIVTIAGVYREDASFQITIDTEKSFLPIRYQLIQGTQDWIGVRSLVVTYTDFRKTSTGAWYAAKMQTVPNRSELHTMHYALEGFEDQVKTQSADLDVRFPDAIVIEDYTQFWT